LFNGNILTKGVIRNLDPTWEALKWQTLTF